MQVKRLTLIDKELVYKCDELFVSFCGDQEKYDYNYQKIKNMSSFLTDVESDDKILLCMEKETEVLGFLYGYIEKKKNMKKPVAHLTFIYVDEKNRRKGIASSLINEYMKLLKEKNIRTIEVKAYVNNESANALYDKFGFSKLWVNYRKRI